MDLLDVIIALDMEAAVERKREENRQMKELLSVRQAELEEKAEECEILKREKQSMLANEAAKQKLVDEFMLFIDNNHVENAQFDEKAMMDAILTMLNGGAGNSGDNAGFSADDGKKEG